VRVFPLAGTLGALAAACSADPSQPPPDDNGSGGAGNGGSSAGAAGSVSPAGGSTTVGGSGAAGQSGSSTGGRGGAAGVGAGGGSSGTSGTTGTGAGGQGGAAGATVTFSQIRTLIPGTCGGAMCHTARQQPTLANDANLYSTLLNTAVSECGGARLVVPGNSQGSAILQLVNRQCSKDGEPFYMPHDCTSNPCLPASQIRTITNWIQAGAPGP
jgi:hypothetical protein